MILDSNITYFGIPLYFFRGNLTSATENLCMAKVHWIPFRLQKQSGTTFLGDIEVITWLNWNEGTQIINRNLYITTNQFRQSRYALAYIPISEQDIYVDVGFVALDAENLYEE